MDQLFNRYRFWLLLKYEYAVYGKSLLLHAALITGAMLVFMLPILGGGKERNFILHALHLLPLFLCVILGGSLFTHTAFLRYGNATSGIGALMLPASRLEKFLVILLPRLFFILLFITLYWELHHWIIGLANSRLAPDVQKYGHVQGDEAVFITYCYFLFQGVVFLGSVYFSRNAYVKSTAAFLVVFVGAIALQNWLVNVLTSRPGVQSFPFTAWFITEGKDYQVVFPEPVGLAVWIFLVLLVVTLVYIAFVRLEEKEI